MTPAAKEIITRLLVAGGADRVSRLYYGGRGSILMFHRVVDGPDGAERLHNDALEVSASYLEQMVRFLAKDYAFIPLDGVPAYLRGNDRRRFICLTFDDGYRETFTLAYPVLKKQGAPFTVYVATCFPEQRAVLWHYALEDLLVAREHVEVEVDGVRRAWRLQSHDDKLAAFDDLSNCFYRADPRRRDQLCEALFSANGIDVAAYGSRMAMSWDQVAALARDPLVSIGAHALSHVPLASLPDAEAEREMADSKRIIEERAGCAVRHFSYPFGSRGAAGPREFALARKTGYVTATTTRRGNIFPEHLGHLFALPRIDTGRTRRDLTFLRSQVSGLRLFMTGHLGRMALDAPTTAGRPL